MLASLPDNVRQRITDAAILLELDQGEVLQRQGTPLSHVYFPTRGLVTGVLSAVDGTQFAYLRRGREGAIYSIAAARLDDSVADCTLVVDVAATMLAVPMSHFRRVMRESPEVTHAVLMHAAYSIKWLERTLNCPAHHPIQARTAYWLLVLSAYGAGRVMRVTHGRIAEVLGVRRQSISEALGELQDQDAISLGRERIVIRDLTSLRRHACECRAQIEEVVRLHRAGHLPSAA
ncbi:MAG: Crp/Fnr family transcriptional regulator [Chloroflexi bacterium]|nr:Crp/Fnr family transcriptional regulator [Chloroflexota bacterium]